MCKFTDAQLAKLRQPLEMNAKCLFFAPEAGKALAGKPYIPQHVVIETANEIFAFSWESEDLGHGLIFEEQATKYNKAKTESWPVYVASYWAKVRITAGSATHTAIGVCTSAPMSGRGEAHELALMGAESVAKKRAFYNLGMQFGGSLKDPFDPEGRETSERMMADTGYPEPATPPPTMPAPGTVRIMGTNTFVEPAPAQTTPAPAFSNAGDATITPEGVLKLIKDFGRKFDPEGKLRPAVIREKGLNANAIRSMAPAELATINAAIQQEWQEKEKSVA